MTHEDRGHYGKKHPPDREVNPGLADAVKQVASNGEISCAAAFKIAGDLKASPAEIGFTIDSLEVTIVKCRLGLYGYKPRRKIVRPADTVSQDLEDAIRGAMVEGRLSCAASWEIADRFGMTKMEISSACETLKVKISPCQLGCF